MQAPNASGISSLKNLQADLKAGRLDRFRYFVFDILHCEGKQRRCGSGGNCSVASNSDNSDTCNMGTRRNRGTRSNRASRLLPPQREA